MPVPLHQLQRELRISIFYLKDSVLHLKSGEKNPKLYSYKYWSIKIRLTLLTSVHPATAPSRSGFPTQNWVLTRGNYCCWKIQWAKWIFSFFLSLFSFFFFFKFPWEGSRQYYFKIFLQQSCDSQFKISNLCKKDYAHMSLSPYLVICIHVRIHPRQS